MHHLGGQWAPRSSSQRRARGPVPPLVHIDVPACNLTSIKMPVGLSLPSCAKTCPSRVFILLFFTPRVEPAAVLPAAWRRGHASSPSVCQLWHHRSTQTRLRIFAYRRPSSVHHPLAGRPNQARQYVSGPSSRCRRCPPTRALAAPRLANEATSCCPLRRSNLRWPEQLPAESPPRPFTSPESGWISSKESGSRFLGAAASSRAAAPLGARFRTCTPGCIRWRAPLRRPTPRKKPDRPHAPRRWPARSASGGWAPDAGPMRWRCGARRWRALPSPCRGAPHKPDSRLHLVRTFACVYLLVQYNLRGVLQVSPDY